MKIKKSIDIKQDTLDALNEKYPDIAFTKLVERGLQLLLNPEIVNKKVTLDEDTMGKFNRLCERVLDMHKEFINK